MFAINQIISRPASSSVRNPTTRPVCKWLRIPTSVQKRW
jgi:hypothetical protein